MRTLICLLLLISVYARAAEQTATSLTQSAASQRALVERMARTFAWRWVEPDNAAARDESDASADQFEHQLAQLSDAARHDRGLADDYALLVQLWPDYRSATAARANRHNAAKLLDQSEDIGWAADKAAQAMIAKHDHKARPVELAEQVAALSQRLAKIYLLQSAGLKVPFLAKDLLTARADFQRTSARLHALPDNTPKLREQIALMDTQWLFLQQAIDELAAHQADPQLRHNVITTSDRIYQVATDLAARYQRAMG